MRNSHPRFLGFLWKRHKYIATEDNPCTERCVYCDKELHTFNYMKVVEEESQDLYYENLKCEICGREETKINNFVIWGLPH